MSEHFAFMSVSINGQKVGEVEDVRLFPKGPFRVTAELQRFTPVSGAEGLHASLIGRNDLVLTGDHYGRKRRFVGRLITDRIFEGIERP